MNIHIIKRQYSEIISVREKKGRIMKEFFSMGKTMKKLISVVMSLALLLTSAGVVFSGSDVKGAAAEVVSSMDYYSTNDGPTITHSGVGTVSYGFVMPKFNGKASSELSIADVEKDIQVYVKQENVDPIESLLERIALLEKNIYTTKPVSYTHLSRSGFVFSERPLVFCDL